MIRHPYRDLEHWDSKLHPVLKQVLARRGIEHDALLDKQLSSLLPPNALHHIDAAVAILLKALENQSRIIIVGDFDADGATSTALLMSALPQFGFLNVDFIVPDRFRYGYGLSCEIVDLVAQHGCDLIITVDNGISSIDGVDHANSLGMQVLVTDHHLPGDQIPNAAAIVNPNQRACEFPSKNLAGVGVAFYLVVALRAAMRSSGLFESKRIAIPNLSQCLDLVALGTVADVVSLDENNRILVEHGLQRIRSGRARAGIQALIDVAKRESHRLVASDLGFAIGPRLNAVGRLDDMALGIECLICNDVYKAREYASEMDSLNAERKTIEKGMQHEAEAFVATINFEQSALPKALSLYQSDWHQGVVGLVASRIKEKFHRPVFAFADGENGDLKGSGRSVPGVHLRDLLERIDTQNPGLIAKYGGHAMAAGLSLKQGDFERFQEQLRVHSEQFIDEQSLSHSIYSDGELPVELLNLDFAEKIRALGPWGQGFAEPIFDGVFQLRAQRVVGQSHLKLSVSSALAPQLQLDAIAFNVDREIWPNASVQLARLVYKLDINEFRGRRSVQLLIESLEPA
ncbi:single-stranded-DNA-specific exonuclease RecJ [Alginatibacterium sediminis]|uniref:Single-stranded-DNA-specific exonuclease RecJ n=1 Tax=Alginatibacterium sediminis TaxID=2164068 RepID=A0A420E9M5_9ALTE|nr:single-stranded-DNA-specific exonuclease RecJ [Alginatibacterium sediminis]